MNLGLCKEVESKSILFEMQRKGKLYKSNLHEKKIKGKNGRLGFVTRIRIKSPQQPRGTHDSVFLF